MESIGSLLKETRESSGVSIEEAMFCSLLGDKYLSTSIATSPLRHFDSFVRALLPNLDFSLVGFTAFHFHRFQFVRYYGTLSLLIP